MITTPKSNDIYYDITNQARLSLVTWIEMPKGDSVHSFNEILEGINLTKYLSHSLPHGNQSFNHLGLLKGILFAYTDNKRSLREMELAFRTDIRYMWLTGEMTPSHTTIQRFINDHLIGSIDEIFYDIVHYLIKTDNIDTTKLLIDGTKIEAYARKTSFVWKKAILNFQEKLYKKITTAILDMNEKILHLLPFHISKTYEPEYIKVIVDFLSYCIERNDIEFVYGKGRRKTDYQRFYETFSSYESKLIEYKYHLEVCRDRNSYSKTDKDATFMNMKYDYYNQTGVFKPGYNLQVGVSDEYIIHLGLYPNPGDTKTFIPFMESYKERYGQLPKYPITDAGYGSYENYMYCLINKMQIAMKYNYFDLNNGLKKKKKNPYAANNFEENEAGYKVCPQGHAFDQHVFDSKNDRGRYLQINQVYETGKCGECPIKSECTKAKGERRLRRNVILEEFQKEADKLLMSEIGGKMRSARSAQAEGAFGILKENKKFTRFNRRGQEKVETEMYLIAIGFNIRKYHSKKARKPQELIS